MFEERCRKKKEIRENEREREEEEEEEEEEGDRKVKEERGGEIDEREIILPNNIVF